MYGVTEDGLPNLDKRLQTFEDIKQDVLKVIPTETAYKNKDRQFLKFVFDAVIYTKNQPDSARYIEYIDDMLTQRNYAETVHALNQFNIGKEHNGLVQGNGLASTINTPTLVLRGDRDLIITEDMINEIMNDIGDYAEFVELKDCGHSPLIDDLDQLLNIISEFLD
jgi:pimeloyl-ACP methyl ester carboxylesterase